VNVAAYEPLLRQARARQETEEFKTLYRRRSRVERKQAELVRHGLRDTRYLGPAKRRLKHLWTAAVVNLKRLFRLADASNGISKGKPLVRPVNLKALSFAGV
jgi:hypothetical protein